MIKFINKHVIQNVCTSRPSKNGGTVYMTDILPIVTGEHQKPLGRIYSTTDNLPAPIWELPMKCQNRLNEATGNINTNFDVVLDSEDGLDNDTYIVAAFPFNGIITSISASDNVDILNGCFSKVTPFTVESAKDDKVKYSKILYLLLYVKSDKDITITFDTESVSFPKGNKQTKKSKSVYTNTFSINIDDIDDIEYICKNERVSTVDIDETEDHTSPKFSSILGCKARIDVRVGTDKNNENKHKDRAPKTDKGYECATFGNIATIKSHDKSSHYDDHNKNSKRGGGKSESTYKAMKKLDKYKNKFGE